MVNRLVSREHGYCLSHTGRTGVPNHRKIPESHRRMAWSVKRLPVEDV
jgi:hypothetical protein